MSIISQETWEKFTEQEKEDIRHIYNGIEPMQDKTIEDVMNSLFGKENLQPKPQPKIKTWRDVEKLLPEDGFCVGEFEKFADNPKVLLKCQATLKIAKLIELGYGGIITDEEWEERINEGTGFFTIVYSPLYKSFHTKVESCNKQFIAFHTNQQVYEFMSHPENVKLLRQYYLL